MPKAIGCDSADGIMAQPFLVDTSHVALRAPNRIHHFGNVACSLPHGYQSTSIRLTKGRIEIIMPPSVLE